MNDTVKLIIEIPTDKYLSIKTNMINDFIYDAVKHGILLDNDSEKAEVQAYFAGQAYGWEQGRKELIDDIKAEFRISYPTNYAGEPELNGAACCFSLNKIFKILDDVSKGDN